MYLILILLASSWIICASVATWRELRKQNSFFFWAKIYKSNNDWFATSCFCIPAILRVFFRNMLTWPCTLEFYK